MPELPRPPENTPPWVWVVGTALAAFIIAATPIILPRIFDGLSQGNTAQNVPAPQVPSPSLGSSPSPTPSVEYKGDSVGEMPYREGAITVESNPRTIIAQTDGVIEVCSVESKYSFQGSSMSLIQEIEVITVSGEKDLLISSTTECQKSKIRLTQGQQFKIWLNIPDRNDLKDLPNFRNPKATIK